VDLNAGYAFVTNYGLVTWNLDTLSGKLESIGIEENGLILKSQKWFSELRVVVSTNTTINLVKMDPTVTTINKTMFEAVINSLAPQKIKFTITGLDSRNTYNVYVNGNLLGTYTPQNGAVSLPVESHSEVRLKMVVHTSTVTTPTPAPTPTVTPTPTTEEGLLQGIFGSIVGFFLGFEQFVLDYWWFVAIMAGVVVVVVYLVWFRW